MHLNATDQRYVNVPVYGPAGVDLTQLAVKIAIIPESAGEPQSTDYHAATWVTGSADVARGTAEAQILVSAGSLTAGTAYMAWLTLTSGSEIPVMKSGRISVGVS